VNDTPADDGELWEIHRGDQPLLATAIHDGHHVRAEAAELMAISEADRLREEDPYTARWTTVAPNRIIARRSRFEVDLNRPPEKAVYLTPDDSWGIKVWKRRPSQELTARSLSQYWAFYDLVRAILNDIEQQFGDFVVFDIHSYNHRRGGPEAPPDDPKANPVVNIGTGSMDRDLWAPLVDRFIADLSDQEVAGTKLDVRENVKFTGGQLSHWVHETYPEHGCSLAIEFKKVYMDEWTGEPDDGVIAELEQALLATLPGLFESLAAR
jgi:N-formylglutamate amidohydrolase